jgi:hypothetical protein
MPCLLSLRRLPRLWGTWRQGSLMGRSPRQPARTCTTTSSICCSGRRTKPRNRSSSNTHSSCSPITSTVSKGKSPVTQLSRCAELCAPSPPRSAPHSGRRPRLSRPRPSRSATQSDACARASAAERTGWVGPREGCLSAAPALPLVLSCAVARPASPQADPTAVWRPLPRAWRQRDRCRWSAAWTVTVPLPLAPKPRQQRLLEVEIDYETRMHMRFLGVSDGIRTHDIQDHNLAL